MECKNAKELKESVPVAVKKVNVRSKACNTDPKLCGHVYTKDEKDLFLLSSWYESFKKVTIPTICLVMPEDYALHLGTGCEPDDKDDSNAENEECKTEVVKTCGSQWSDDEEENDDDPFSWDNPISAAFFSDILEAIGMLGGSVVPKVLWKVPTDTKQFILEGPKCKIVTDVNNLLRFSSRAHEDITNPYRGVSSGLEEKPKPYLYLRKWINIQDSNLFRCFIYGGKLVAISQRDLSIGYKSIVSDKDGIILDIYNFYRQRVHCTFGNGLRCYSIDVIRFAPGVVQILDFNICDDDTLLPYFSWEEFIVMWEGMISYDIGIYDIVEGPEHETEKTEVNASGNAGYPNNLKDKKLYRGTGDSDTKLPDNEVYGNPYFQFSNRFVFDV